MLNLQVVFALKVFIILLLFIFIFLSQCILFHSNFHINGKSSLKREANK